jgi:hypothetical protein
LLEGLVAEVDFYYCLEERFDPLFVRGLVEDHANSSSQSPTRLPTKKVLGELYSCPLEGISFARLPHHLADADSLISSTG